MRPTLSVAEVADLLGISRTSAYKAAHEDALPVKTLKIGSRFVIPAKPLLEALGLEELPKTAA